MWKQLMLNPFFAKAVISVAKVCISFFIF